MYQLNQPFMQQSSGTDRNASESTAALGLLFAALKNLICWIEQKSEQMYKV